MMHLDKLFDLGGDFSAIKAHHEYLAVHAVKVIPRGR